MTTTHGDVRQALADAVMVGTGYECHAYVRSGFAAPCAYISREEMDPRTVFSQSRNVYNYRVWFLFPWNEEEEAQKQADELCDVNGDRSAVLAIQDDTEWPSGLVDYAVVTNVGGLQAWRPDTDGPLLGVSFDVEVCW